MKPRVIKGIVSFIAIFQFAFGYAQERYEVVLKNDTVYNHGVAQFLCKFKGSDKGDVYSLKTLENKTAAILIIKPFNENVKFSGTFPLLGVRYACLYPKMEIITLLDSYIRNKVFVNGNVSLEGLQNYCKDRSLSLDKPPVRKAQSPAIRDSTLSANARADAASQIKFTFHNNANRPVRIFIGDKPKGGSGRIQVIAPNGDLAEHARKTEKIFLLNDAGDSIKSIPVTDELKRIVINAAADGFE